MIAESYGELRGELKGLLTGLRESLDPQARTRKAEFKFANEHDAAENGGDIPVEPWRKGPTIIN
jgi:hypothetical protein